MRIGVASAVVVAAALAGCGGSQVRTPEVAGDAPASATATATAAPATPTAGAAATVKLQRIGNFDSPLYVTAPPGDKSRLFVVEQGGAIRVVQGGKVLKTPFLNLKAKITSGGERGLLSMAFAPDYASSGLFYVDYTDTNGDSRIVEYKRATADVADPGSARLVLFQKQPEPNHNGGLLLFGPDKLLYVGFGDGGGGGDRHGAHGNAQSLGTLLGKILRIDPRPDGARAYGIPASNPFVGRAGARGEIYAYGLRNPWRFSFDSANGDLAIGDVGQDAIEEVDFMRNGAARGANFGWRVYEGNARYTPSESAPGAIKPVITERHSDGNCSVIGGIIVRDPALSAWRGRYVFGDECRGVLQTAKLSQGHVVKPKDTSLKVSNLSSFGEDAAGHVYATSLSGPVYRLVQR
jgi:glucose/arabinose dehydrogenase